MHQNKNIREREKLNITCHLESPRRAAGPDSAEGSSPSGC